MLKDTRLILTGLIAMVMFPLGCSLAKPAEGPNVRGKHTPYPVVYAAEPPTIDGKLDDDIWQRAVPWRRFYEYRQEGIVVDIGTAYLAWDTENLYFAIRVNDTDLYVTENQNDAILCQADVAELFVKPSEDRLDVYEFEFNMWSAVWDIHYISRGGGSHRRFTAFDSGAIAKATHTGTINDWNDIDTEWTVEVAIPLKAFRRAAPSGPRPGHTWKFNISGYDFSVHRETTLLFTSCDGNKKGFIEYEIYPTMQFQPPVSTAGPASDVMR